MFCLQGLGGALKDLLGRFDGGFSSTPLSRTAKQKCLEVFRGDESRSHTEKQIRHNLTIRTLFRFGKVVCKPCCTSSWQLQMKGTPRGFRVQKFPLGV